jgi:hypothetical protein
MHLTWILAALCNVLLSIYLHAELNSARGQVATLRGTVTTVTESNQTLTDSLALQNAKVTALQATAGSGEVAATERADTTLQTLPAKIVQDHRAGPTPTEANQWLTNLFSE